MPKEGYDVVTIKDKVIKKIDDIVDKEIEEINSRSKVVGVAVDDLHKKKLRR